MEKNNKEALKLRSSGDNISILLFVIGMLMIFAIVGTFFTGNIGLSIALVLTTILFFIFGTAIKALFNCIASITENTEKQTELLEKLNEKLNGN